MPKTSYNSAPYYDYNANYGMNSYGYGGCMSGLGLGLAEGGWAGMYLGSGSAPSSSEPMPRQPPPPPPPPAPASSTWDFLNLFEGVETNYYTTPSLDSRKVREREGILDLEDEDFEHEVVKEVDGNQKLVEESSVVSDSKSGGSKRVTEDEGTRTSILERVPFVLIREPLLESCHISATSSFR